MKEARPEAEEESPPIAVIGTVADLARWMPGDVARVYGKRPIWFFLEMDSELVTVFEQLPEDPMPKGKVDAIMSGLRQFAAERAEVLQTLLGPTDSISLGFHVDASLEQVTAAFESDGFFVLSPLRDGEIEDIA